MESTRDEMHGRVQLHIELTCVSTAWPDWGRSTLLLNSKAPEQMTAECWRWRPRWNQLPSTSCFGSSACLQSLSSVLCRAAYGLKSPQDRLGGTHAKAAAHPDKLTVCGRHWYYAGGTHCCLFCALNKLLLEIITVYPNEIAVKFENGTVFFYRHL